MALSFYQNLQKMIIKLIHLSFGTALIVSVIYFAKQRLQAKLGLVVGLQSLISPVLKTMKGGCQPYLMRFWSPPTR